MNWVIFQHGDRVAHVNSTEARDAARRLLGGMTLSMTLAGLAHLAGCAKPPTPVVVPPVASEPAHVKPDCTKR